MPFGDHNLVYEVTTKTLFSFGANDRGQLGINHIISQHIPQPIAFFRDHNIIKAAHGCRHSIVLTSKGLFVFGNNDCGQLAQGSKEYLTLPQKVDFFDDHNILDISCGYYHSLVLTSKGLFSFGCNTHLELGVGYGEGLEAPEQVKVPVDVKFFMGYDVLSISCGGYHSLVLTSEGLFGFGNNLSGQLGLGTVYHPFEDVLRSPQGSGDYPHTDMLVASQKIQFFSDQKILYFCCGAEYSMVLTPTGLFSFGSNRKGQLGLGHANNQGTPQQISFFKDHEILSVACGSYHSFVLTSKGLFSFGYNSCGQLGLFHREDQNKPTTVSFFSFHQVFAITCGNGHSLVLTAEGLFGIGNSRWGQIGLSPDIEPAFFCPQKIESFSQAMSLNIFDSFRDQRSEKAAREASIVLLCSRKFCPQSPFYEEYLPLDLFKYIFALSYLTKHQRKYFRTLPHSGKVLDFSKKKNDDQTKIKFSF